MSDQHQPSNPAAAAAPLFNRAAWARILPFLAYLFFIVVVDGLTRLGVDAQSLRWLYALKVGVVLLMLVIFWRHYTELHSTRPTPIGIAIALAAGVAVFYLWIGLNAGWMVVGSPAGFDPRTAGQIDWALVVVRIGGAALVVPVMEELFWRSFLMRWIDDIDFERIDPRKVKALSVAIAAVLFGFEHNQWLAGIVAGLAYSVLYMRQRNLWSAILAHAVTNGVLGVWIVRCAMWTYW